MGSGENRARGEGALEDTLDGFDELESDVDCEVAVDATLWKPVALDMFLASAS